VTPRPLKPEQHQAAQLLGEGRDQQATADEVGTTTTTIRRWLKRDDFAALVKAAREKRLDENPTARAVCEQALTATQRNGQPAWNTRLAAAKLLMLDSADESGGGLDGSARLIERIYVDPEE
jgi:hypothetical protein